MDRIKSLQHHNHRNGDSNGSHGDDAGKRQKNHHNMMLLHHRQTESSSSSSSSSLWQAYKEWVYRNETKLHWMDEIVSRLLWWLPAGGSGSGRSGEFLQEQQHHQHQRWPREVIWGLLQLNRLFVDLALEEKYQQERQHGRWDHNGTTLQLQQLHDDFEVTSHRLRMGLDIIQSLWPVALELAAATATTTTSISSSRRLTIQRRQAAVGLVLERVRFVLKLYFLIRYWKQWRKQQQQETDSRRIPIPPGIMQLGGLLTAAAASSSSSNSSLSPTLEQEQARLERANYVGRRTGRRVVGSPLVASPAEAALSASSSPSGAGGGGGDDDSLLQTGWRRRIKSFLLSSNLSNNKTTMIMMRLVVGELLYVFRPLFWAQAQWDGYNHDYAVGQMAAAASAAAGVGNPIIDITTGRGGTCGYSDGRLAWLWKAWLISLGMDVTSLLSLSNIAATATATSNDPRRHGAGTNRTLQYDNNNNPATVQEWKRRRLRLLLYLLRSPVWEVYTERITDAEHGGSLGGRLSRHVPLVGGLLVAYLQDWLYYWKVYRAEEG